MTDTALAAYERDPRQRALGGAVRAARVAAARRWARLSDTGLYPEGGGQPAARGWLGEIAVEEVQRRGGEVFHVLASAASPGRATVRLDWARRFDHMQQHTATHLLSAIAADRFGWETTAFYLGGQTCEVEVAA